MLFVPKARWCVGIPYALPAKMHAWPRTSELSSAITFAARVSPLNSAISPKHCPGPTRANSLELSAGRGGTSHLNQPKPCSNQTAAEHKQVPMRIS